MRFLKGARTYITGILIVAIGAIIQYQQGCDAADPATIDLCAKVQIPGAVISALGGLAVLFRKLATTDK